MCRTVNVDPGILSNHEWADLNAAQHGGAPLYRNAGTAIHQMRAREATFVQEAAIISETQHEEIVSVIVADMGMNGTPLNYKG